MIEYNLAVDEMSALFKNAWNAGTTMIAGYVPEVRWLGNEIAVKPPSGKYWARFSTQNLTEEQATLSNCVEAPGSKHYTSSGLVFIQLFAPKSVNGSFTVLRLLAILARSAFRGKTTPGKVWFRNVRINEISPENEFYRINVVAEYEFDEVG